MIKCPTSTSNMSPLNLWNKIGLLGQILIIIASAIIGLIIIFFVIR